MSKDTMLVGKSAMTGITIGSTTFAEGDTGQGARTVVATGAAIVLFGIVGRNAHAACCALGAGMTARAFGGHGYGQ